MAKIRLIELTTDQSNLAQSGDLKEGLVENT